MTISASPPPVDGSAFPPSSPTPASPSRRPSHLRVALLGNPNTGKTTLFNRLTGLRHKTANFPGTTLEARIGRVTVSRARDQAAGETTIELIDLPGIYSLELDQLEARVARDALAGRTRVGQVAEPDAVCVILDAGNLSRNLRLAGEALRRRLPTVVAVNMIDLARKRALHIDPAVLAEHLGCEVILCNARGGEGLADLREALVRAKIPSRTPPGDEDRLTLWAQEIYAAAASSQGGYVEIGNTLTDRADRIAAHPVLGMIVFLAIMAGLFYTIFSLASVPMDLISVGVDWLSTAVAETLPVGLINDFLAQGIIPGVGTVVIFLPQICLLFFLISLLEDTGYLARGAFLMDRMLRPFGLPGHAFVPLLSSHACALPGIIACRAVPDPKERLATILVAPFMSCSARLPVYALLTGILFPDSPALAALAFIGCYALGALAGVLSALLARRTILRGKSQPMALELPSYKWPSLRTAAITTWDRGLVFVKNAGTNILAICVILWWLGAFPRMEPPARIDELRQQAALVENSQPTQAAELAAQAEDLEAHHARDAKRQSFLGQMGRAVQPVLEPLGYDWQLTVGVIASFAAREVFAGTMAIIVTGHEDTEDQGVLDQIAAAKRDDGRTPIFTRPVAWSLLVFYVLAMQCLPTLVVTAREAGGVKWALLQLGWMSALAYAGAMLVYHVTS